jgi:SNF2 family DNA or RNA helicase
MQFTPPFPTLSQLKSDYIRSDITYHRARHLLDMEMGTLTSSDDLHYRVVVEDRFEDFTVNISLENNNLSHKCTCASRLDCCHHSAAALLLLEEEFSRDRSALYSEKGEAYTREEMIERVLKEREERAEKEDFRITFADNVYGVHQLNTAAHRLYEITVRDFDRRTGYCSCPDYRTNKLGTCKHLMAVFREIHTKLPVKKLTETQPYPFVEIYCDPINDYHITYFYKGNLTVEIASLLEKYFKGNGHILPEHYPDFLNFLKKAEDIKKILVRPEVRKKIDRYFDQQLFQRLSETIEPDFSNIKATLFDYQKEGIKFSLFKKGNIIADEMGLGKTLQAISIAMLKKEMYGLKRALIICPASLKFQWKKEIERFSDEKAAVVEGLRKDRHEIYRSSDTYFLITNYEAVMRDITVIIKNPPDLVILDEAQRIKNYTTKTSYAVKAIPKRHSLVITGTPIENRLGDLYSITNFIEPEILAPLWEFSMNHCYFDKTKKEKITGYYNLQALKERLGPWVIRREKKEVLDQLPDVQEITVPVELHPYQQDMHAGFARALMPYLQKKHKTIYDMQRIQQLLMSMRMVCNSSFLIDKETHYSPKLDELQEILFDKLDISRPGKKIIVFSEWKTMLWLIEKMLKTNRLGSVTLSGEVPVKHRGKLIEEFRSNPDCRVFLSTEAGGTGLNLQFADTVINFELPWNPAKKNQRIGRVHRIGQESAKVTAINLVARQSIEERILDGITLKESLFEAVLNEGNLTDEVDFSRKGRSVFLEQVEQLVKPFEYPTEEEEAETREEAAEALREKPAEKDPLSPFEDEEPAAAAEEPVTEEPAATPLPTEKPAAQLETQELETTLNQGLQFLSGLMKMATGNELVAQEQAISVDKETGEVVMKFKLPGF